MFVLFIFIFTFISLLLPCFLFFFFFKQKTAYEMRISDWSSDVCSSDLIVASTSNADIPGAAPADVERLANPIGRGVAQLFARRIDPFVDGELDVLPLHAALSDQPVLNALIDHRARVAARRKDGGRVALRLRQREPQVGCRDGRPGTLEHTLVSDLPRRPPPSDLGAHAQPAPWVGPVRGHRG